MTLTTTNTAQAHNTAFQMPVRSMTLTTGMYGMSSTMQFQMPVRSMTLTTDDTSHGA